MAAKKSSGDSPGNQGGASASDPTVNGSVKDGADPARRRMLTNGVAAVGGLGALALVTPMLGSMSPSERAKAAGAPVEADISKLAPGQLLTVEWRGKPVWIVRRTEAALESLQQVRAELRDPDSEVEQQPAYAQNETRSIESEVLVMIGLCTHLGCSPTFRPDIAPADLGADWLGGFFCPCHGSKFDYAGRVYSGVPAPTNLEVPPHKYLSDSLIVVGEDQEAAA